MSHLNYLSRSLFFGLLICFAQHLSAQCVPDTSLIGGPGVYPDSLPPVTGCQFFEQEVTFVFPRDTTVTIGGGNVVFPFNYFRIDSISGLPDGVDWACNLSPDCLYSVHPDSANVDTVGCITLFGTPSIPATYPLQVWVTAQVIIFGSPGDNPAAFAFPLTVSPCEFTGDCYTLNLSSSCEPAVLSLTNEVPSNGNAGYSYQWSVVGDNGFSYQSSDENPGPQTLSDAGTYIVSYEGEIDTLGYFLNDVVIESVNCGDPLGGAGDLYWILLDPNGTELVNTIATPINNGGDNVPLNTGIGGILLNPGGYEFQVWDDDSNLPLNADDGCATNTNGSGASVFFTAPPLNPGPLTVTVDGLTVTFTIDHPVTELSCADTFTIAPLPDEPNLLRVEDSLYLPFQEICARDTLFLRTTSTDSLQWFRDGGLIVGESDSILAITEAGEYWVEAISRGQFCRIPSSSVEVEVLVVQPPSIAFDGNMTVSIASPTPNFIYEWYEDGAGLAGSGSSFQLSGSGSYYAVTVDIQSGCASLPSVVLDIVLASIGSDPTAFLQTNLYPNPSSGYMSLKTAFSFSPQRLHLQVIDLMGRNVWKRDLRPQGQDLQAALDFTQLPAGLYQLIILADEQQKRINFQIQKE